MKDFCVDIHVHPTLKPVYCGSERSIWDEFVNDSDIISGWLINEGTMPGMVFGTQCSLKQAVKGKVKILGISIFTYESGWTRTHPGKRGLLSQLTGISSNKLLAIADGSSDIYHDTIEESNYLTRQISPQIIDGVSWSFKPLTKSILEQIKNRQIDLETENCIYYFYNIEGIQTFGIRSATSRKELSDDEKKSILDRIDEIKTKEHVPQYVTICHHFGNHVAGHARTIPRLLNSLNLDQSLYLNDGITNAGIDIIKSLLSTENGPTIPVDIKHFSATSRIQYYKLLNDEYSYIDPNGHRKYVVPIICSHTGVANEPQRLDDMERHAINEYNATGTWLHNWSVNMCREDLEMIFHSDGLLGIQIDLKRLTGDKYLEKFKAVAEPGMHVARKALSCEVVWANIFTAVALLVKDINDSQYKKVWDMFSIGSDYDGIVSYLPEYSNLGSYLNLKRDMIVALRNVDTTFKFTQNIKISGRALDAAWINELMLGFTADELGDKVFGDNAIAFMAKNFAERQ